jgi:hypothetical protein
MKRGREEHATSSSVPTAPATREPFVKRPVAAEVAQSIRHLVIKLVFGEEHINTDRYFGKGQNELPGPLAVAVSRRHLPVLCTQGYMACEKSDGERAMLLLVGSAGTAGIPGRFSIPPGAYLIGRDFDAEAIVGGEQYAPLCCASGGLVLADGELIIRPDDAGSGTNACAVYMVFDCMRWGAEDVGRAPLDVRLQAIADKLRLPCRDEDDRRARAGTPGLPLLLLGKHFVPKARVGTIFACISERPPHLHQQHAAAAAGAVVGRLTAALETEAGGEAPHRLYRPGRPRASVTRPLAELRSRVRSRSSTLLPSCCTGDCSIGHPCKRHRRHRLHPYVPLLPGPVSLSRARLCCATSEVEVR